MRLIAILSLLLVTTLANPANAAPSTDKCLKAEFVHNTTIGGDGDKLHPNRLGYIAMGMAIDLELLKPPASKPGEREAPLRQQDAAARRVP